MPELKPCPHCKGQVQIKEGFDGTLFFECTECGGLISFNNAKCYRNQQKAIEAWNKRVGVSRLNEFAKEKEALTNLITCLEDCMAEGSGKIFDKDAKEAYADNKILRDACKLCLKSIEHNTPHKPIMANGDRCYSCGSPMQWKYPHCPFCG